MKAAVTPFAMAALLVAGSARAVLDTAAAQTMMDKDGCTACHAIDRKGRVGPAYVDVAAKYKGDKDAPAKLTKKVREGGAGVWGPTPMPPNGRIPPSDIDALVAWILTLQR